MASHNTTGELGEKIAQDYLVSLGYSILKTNWRYKKYEVDIIASKDNKLLFIEVKTRANQLVSGILSVDLKKQKNLIMAANEYLRNHSDEFNVQFDIIAVNFYKNKHKIEHVKDAFYPTL